MVDRRSVTVAPLTVTLIVVGFGDVACGAAVVVVAIEAALELLLVDPQAETPRAAAPPAARAATAINRARMVTA
jgi:MFS-type transporter involved in bile tolerance (Atg22 family)